MNTKDHQNPNQGRIGTWITHKITGEDYRSYVPKPLPPKPAIDLHKLAPLLDKAMISVAGLNAVVQAIPNPALFLYMYVRKEALLSSQIEGTQSSFSDLILFEHDQKIQVSLEDVEEVSHYVEALQYGLRRIDEGFPLCLRLLLEIHGILMKGERGSQKSPGEFRKSQNWIGGTRPGNAMFVPPHPSQLMECLGNLEHFLHSQDLPVLIKAGIAHLQFETIHPFLDGNGRLGRLLIILLLCENKLLLAPILYVSLYLKQKRSMYYRLLQEVREYGTWETWLEFFLEAVQKSADQAVQSAKKITELFDHDHQKIQTLGKARFSCLAVFEHLKRLPQLGAPTLMQEIEISAPAARSSLANLEKLGILDEITGQKRDRVYVYRKYLNILEAGTDPLPD